MLDDEREEFFRRAGLTPEQVERRRASLSKIVNLSGRWPRRRVPHVGYKCAYCGRVYLRCVSADGSRANVYPQVHTEVVRLPNNRATRGAPCPGNKMIAEWVTIWEFTTKSHKGEIGPPKYKKDRYKLNGEDG